MLTFCYSGGLGLLFLFFTCVNMIFWRVFMRISYTCPEHLKFALTVEKWTELVQLTGTAIDWLNEHEKMYDVWLLVAYCATSCSLVQVRPLPSPCFRPPRAAAPICRRGFVSPSR